MREEGGGRGREESGGRGEEGGGKRGRKAGERRWRPGWGHLDALLCFEDGSRLGFGGFVEGLQRVLDVTR